MGTVEVGCDCAHVSGERCTSIWKANATEPCTSTGHFSWFPRATLVAAAPLKINVDLPNTEREAYQSQDCWMPLAWSYGVILDG